MLIASIICFVLAAIMGLSMLANWLTRKSASTTIVYLHGGTAVLGLIFFILYVLDEGVSNVVFPFILFGLAILLGAYVFYRDQFKNQQHLALAIGHAILAVGGLIMLLFYFIAQAD